MRTATVDEAKEHLEELIAAARAGEAVEITAGGNPVASLVASLDLEIPLRASDEEREYRERVIAQLVALGLMKRNPLDPDPSILGDMPPGEGPSGVLQALLDERNEGR